MDVIKPHQVFVAFALLLVASASSAAPVRVDATPDALAAAMRGSRIVILGEVHDNGIQHALRAAALRKLVEAGARPAIAFEQFDRNMQDAIDAARKERPRDVDYLVAQAKGAPSWMWEYYKPFVALALEYDLPIVAANLSRADAMKVAMGEADKDAAVPDAFMREHRVAVERGHCNLLPPEALPGMARAQIARDRSLAQAIAAHARRGVVLLTGNGHARTDIGAPYWLPADARAASKSIALLEKEGDSEASGFDAYVVTAAVERPDQCAELARRMKPKG